MVKESEEIRSMEKEVSENGCYLQLCSDINAVRRRIVTLESQLNSCEQVEVVTADGVVGVGAIVELVDEEGDMFSLEVVSEGLSAPLENKVTLKSPVISKCIGKSPGDEIVLEIQGDIVKYIIHAIRALNTSNSLVSVCV